MHDECVASTRCLAYNVDLGTLQPVHFRADCHCQPLKPDMAQVYRILERKEIPIAQVTRESPDDIRLDIEPADPQTQYTAISHVWADGLANAKYNGLFRCQLERLFDCISDMRIDWQFTNRYNEGSIKKKAIRRSAISERLMRRFPVKRIALWVDAICVPVLDPRDLTKSKLMKCRAIEMMTPTYAGTSRVLVLDRNVIEIPWRKIKKYI